MAENQSVEWKQSWKEDYLKWICGFANAQGGTIYIGIDDGGKVYPLSDSKKLLEDIPNKIRQLLGLQIDINLRNDGSGNYIEIPVPPQPNAISLRGRYYYRSGSVKSELTGTALNEFLLNKAGISWDAQVEARATIDDLDSESIDIFLEDANKTNRLPVSDSVEIDELLHKLRLTEGAKITRAAIILFGKDPSRFFPGASIKIGRFGSTITDLRFQDVIEGGLIRSLPSVLDLLDAKYLPRRIRFEGIHRYEAHSYPIEALREALLNAMVHRRYQSAAHLQIRVSDDQLAIWNDGPLPAELPLEALQSPHASRPRNPLIAEVCFRAGYIDTWGRGIEVMRAACADSGLPMPEFQELNGGVEVTLTSATTEGARATTEGANPESEGGATRTEGTMSLEKMAESLSAHYAKSGRKPRKDTLTTRSKILLALLRQPKQKAEPLAQRIGIGKSTIERHLAALKVDDLVEVQGQGKARAYYPTLKAQALAPRTP